MSRSTTRRRTPVLLSLLGILSLLGVAALSGCATRENPDEGSGPSGTAAANFPVTVQAQDAPKLTLREQPDRIVSLSPTVTETLYAIGAGKQVVAADEYSTYPKKAPNKKGMSGLTPNAEQIAKFKPDVVIVSSDRGGKLTSALEKLGIKTLVLPSAPTLKDAYAQFTLLGKATGHPEAGKKLAHQTRSQIEKIVASTPKPANPLSYYHELSPTYFTMTSTTFVGNVYSLFNLDNIADGDNPEASGGSPQLSPERILAADPDMIFLADIECCGQTAEKVAARPGWDTLTAVRNGWVFELDDDIAGRWGPRVVQFVRAVSEAVTTVTKS